MLRQIRRAASGVPSSATLGLRPPGEVNEWVLLRRAMSTASLTLSLGAGAGDLHVQGASVCEF